MKQQPTVYWVFASLLVAASTLTEPTSSVIEKNRAALCGLLPESGHCEPSKHIFGPAPLGSILEQRHLLLCTDRGAKCTATTMKWPPSRGSLPPGAYLSKGHQISITTKNGIKKQWSASVDAANEDDLAFSKSSSYAIEYHQLLQYFWIQGSHYESGTHEWISYTNGKSHLFNNTPHISPDGNYFLIHDRRHGDPDYAFLKVYLVTDKDIKEVAAFNLAKKFDAQTAQSAKPFWITAHELAIVGSVLSSGRYVDTVIGRIANKGGKWSWIGESKNSGGT